MKDNPGFEIFAIVVFLICLFSVGTIYLNNLTKSYADSIPDEGINRKMVAMVKGSIYESGEGLSVFGTCVDAYDIPVENATATFNAWYPNGTQFVFDFNMTKLQEGYFLYSGFMSAVKGTYLTELICQAEIDGINQTAKAWGEWQNPYWVARLANISGAVGNLSVDLSNLSDQMAAGFNSTISNITFLRVNMTNNFDNTNQLILNTQVIANASVDRNDSLLAGLLYYLINRSEECCPPCQNLTIDEFSVDNPVYWKDWTIKVRVEDLSGNVLSSPDVACVINTTQTPIPEYFTVEGEHFTYTEFIYTRGDWNYNISCFCT